MPESKDNFIVKGLSGTFAGIGTFHVRATATDLPGNKTSLTVTPG